MKTMFLTAENRKMLPALGTQDGVALKDHICYVRFFAPYSSGTWMAFEFDGTDQFFGAVNLVGGQDDWELGYFSLAEMMSVKANIGGRTYPFQGI